MGILGKLKELVAKPRGTKLLAQSPTAVLDLVAFDTTFSMQVTWPGMVTDHPVEMEESFSSSIYRQPLQVAIDALLTDNPVEFVAGLLPAATARSKLVKLEELRDREEPVWIVSSMGCFLDLGIESVDASRDPELGDGIRVSLTLKRLNIISTALVPAQFDFDALVAGAGGTIDLGTQGPIDPRSYTGPTSVAAPGG